MLFVRSGNLGSKKNGGSGGCNLICDSALLFNDALFTK